MTKTFCDFQFFGTINHFYIYGKSTMKILFTVLALLAIQIVDAQSTSNSEALCDSVLLSNGTVKLLNIQETKKNKITYFLCCDDCAVPRELMMSDIDTIIYRKDEISKETTTENMSRMGNTPQLVFTSIRNKDKSKKMKNESKTIIWTSDSIRYKGYFHILNEDSIRINSTTLALVNIISISKPNRAAKITGNALGALFTVVGIGLIGSFGLNDEGLLFGGAAFGVATPFYMMNLIRRKFKLKDKWEVEVDYYSKY